MDKWVTDSIRDVSKFLSRIAAYRDKNIELYLQAHQELHLLLFAFNRQNYSRYLMYHHFELQALKHSNSSYRKGASLTGTKFFTILGDLVAEVNVNRGVKIRGGPMRDDYSISVEAVDDFNLNTHDLAKLQHALKNRMNVKKSSNHNAVVTLANLIHIFFDSYSANTQNITCNHIKNKCNHIKVHYF